MSADREARLPKWAQDELSRLRRETERLRVALDEAKGTDARPALAVRDVYGDAVPVAWDRYDEIRFRLTGAGQVPDAYDWIAFRRRTEGEIEVSGSSVLALIAQASNVMRVSLLVRQGRAS